MIYNFVIIEVIYICKALYFEKNVPFSINNIQTEGQINNANLTHQDIFLVSDVFQIFP